MMEFAVWVFLVSLLVAFVRTIAKKWGLIELAQAHAPNDLIHEMLGCDFCLSFWTGLGICIFLAIFVKWYLIFVPIFSCNLRYDV